MRIYTCLLLALLLCSCANTEHKSEAVPTAESINISDSEVAVHQLPLPAVPDSLSRPSQRADYMLLHFWDALDINDKAQLTDKLLIEQTFSNFIEILPYASSQAAIQDAVDRLFDHLSASPAAYATMADLAEKYLYDSDSPFVNPSLYRFFLTKINNQKILPEHVMAKFKAQSDSLQLN